MERFLLLGYRFWRPARRVTESPRRDGSAGFLDGRNFLTGWGPEIFFNIHAGFEDVNAFGFEELFLEGSVRFADQDFAVGAEDAMPRDAFALRSGAHGAADGTCAAGYTQGFSDGSISKNPAAGNLFHELVNGVERHGKIGSLQ
jgi:hypothetical protein